MAEATDLEDVALLAENLVRVYGFTKPPIDPEVILADEPVHSFGEDFGTAFDGRLEYQPEAREFLLLYNTYGRVKPSGRSRFSFAHEAGHYFIDHHRTYLESGGSAHSSRSGFVSDNRIEHEADTFAASLLMPTFLLGGALNDPDLSTIIKMSNEFRTSLLAAGLRFVKTTSRACTLVVSEAGLVKYAFPSEDMSTRGWLFIRNGARIPPNSVSRKVSTQADNEEYGSIREEKTSVHVWSESRQQDHTLWEQALYQPAYDRTLTLLVYDKSLDSADDEDDD